MMSYVHTKFHDNWISSFRGVAMTRFWDGQTDRRTAQRTDGRSDCTPRPAFAFGDAGKNIGTHWKVLSQGILILNIKALALTVQKLLARLKFQRGGQNYRMPELQNDRMTDRTKTICPPIFDLGGIKMGYYWRKTQRKSWYLWFSI